MRAISAQAELPSTLAESFLSRLGVHALPLRYLLIPMAASLLLALCAQAAIPFWPVPITLQTFAVALIGATLGMRAAVASVGLYLTLGAAGLPVFANGAGGAAYLLGPTGGYLIGFLLAAGVVGYLADRGLCRRFLPTLGCMLLGDLIILSLGVSWLSVYLLDRSTASSLQIGFLFFIPGAVIKSTAAAATLHAASRALRR